MRRPFARPHFEPLESRLLMSADLPMAPLAPPSVEPSPAPAAVHFLAPRELVVLDGTLPDTDTLLDAIAQDRPGADLLVLDPDRDALDQIGDRLASGAPVSAIHLVAHGQAGQFVIRGAVIDASELARRTAQLQTWNLADHADILLYGCHIADGPNGEAFVRMLAELTGADVAASTDLTGSEDRGGDWTLEFATGDVDTATIAGPRLKGRWHGTLAAVPAGPAKSASPSFSTPLAFERNAGQTDAAVEFLARGSGYTVFLDDGNAVIDVRHGDGTGNVVRLSLAGAQTPAASSGGTRLSGTSHYLTGNAGDWHQDVAHFGSVRFDEVYDGIDVQYYGADRRLEYDFLVDAGVDTDVIGLRIDGAVAIEIADGGELVLTLEGTGRKMTFHAPVSYQRAADGAREHVDSRYVLRTDGTVGFVLGDYDRSRDLVIDPILGYATYLGGTGLESIDSVETDTSGNVYVTGRTGSAAFPTSVGAYDTALGGSTDAFVTKFNAAGALQYSTYFGGSSDEWAYNLTVDGSGQVHVVGETASSDFAIVNGADTSHGGATDGFLVKLNAAGSAILYSTFYGGANADYLGAVHLGSGSTVYVAGGTTSATWDGYASAIDTGASGAGSLTWSQTYAAAGTEKLYDMDVDSTGDIWLIGETSTSGLTTGGPYDSTHNGSADVFLVRMSAAGAVEYVSYYGGTGNDYGNAIVVAADNTLYFTGLSYSTSGIASTGAYDTTGDGTNGNAFLVHLDPSQTGSAQRLFGTYYGTSGTASGLEIAIDAEGRPVVVGQTSGALPTTVTARDTTLSGSSDGFVAIFAADGSALRYGSYLGGDGTETANAVAVDTSGRLYVVGQTASTTLHTTGAYDTTGDATNADGFIAQFLPLASAARTSGKGGLSINTDGGNDAYLIADNGGTILGGRTALTLEFDFAVQTAAATDNRLLSYAVAGVDNEVAVHVTAAGNIVFTLENAATTSTSTYTQLLDGNRHQLAITWDRASGNGAFYVDGVLAQSFTGFKAFANIDSGGTLVIGQDQDAVDSGYSPLQMFSGTLHDVRVFSDVRTATEIRAGRLAELPRTEVGLVANWRFDDWHTDGTTTDAVSGNDLTLGHASGTGFVASQPSLTFVMNENAATGTVVGSIAALSDDRQARIDARLAADATLTYSAQTDKFYKRDTNFRTWASALSLATSTTLNTVAGQLVTVRSATENALLSSITGGSAVWLGAADAAVEGTWRWYDGSTPADTFWQGTASGYRIDGAYTNWNGGEPSDTGGEDRLYQQADGTWNDAPDAMTSWTLIEWDADEVLDASTPITYAITSQTVSGAFAVDSDTGVLTVANGSALNYVAGVPHTLTVRVTEGTLTYDRTYTVVLTDEVVEVSASTPGAQSVAEDATLTFSSGGGNAISVSDGSGASNTRMQVSLSVSQGVLNLSQTTGLTIVSGANGSAAMVVDGTESALNAALSGMTYTPTAQYSGSDTLQLTASLSSELAARYTFDTGTVVDSAAGTAQNGSFVGNATTTSNATRGTVLALDGAGDSVQIASVFGSPSNVTVGGWVNLYTAASRGEMISLDDRVHIALDESGVGVKGSIQTGVATWNDLESGRFIAGDGWHHVMFVVDDTNDVNTLYIDGMEVASETNTSSVYWTGATTTYLGQHPSNPFYLHGLLDDMRVYTRALSAGEVAALASEQRTSDPDTIAVTVSAVNDAPEDLYFVPELAESSLTGVYTFSVGSDLGRDAAGEDATMTLYGSPGQTTGPTGSGALDLAGGGSGQYGDIAGITTGGAMTIAAQVRFDSTGDWQRIVDFGQANSTGISAIYVGRFWNTNDLTFTIERDLGGGNWLEHRATAAGAIVDGTWMHFAATVDGTGAMALYVNGVLADTEAGIVPEVGARTNNFVGRSNWGGDALFDGAIDNLVVASGALSAAGVAALYQQSNAVTIADNAADGTVLGTIVVADIDSANTHTFSLTSNPGARFAVAADGTLTVANGSLLDYETATSHAITARATDSGSLTRDEVFTVTLTAVNEAPSFVSLNGTPAHTEGGAAVVLDGDVQITDPELTAANAFSGATLTLARNGGANADDALAFDGTNVTVSGANVLVGGTQVGTYVFTGGELVVTFGANATQARVNTLLQNIVYWNWSDAPPASVQIDWTFNDGNTGSQGSGGALQATGSTTVTITGVNDVPVITGLDGDVRAYTEGSAAVLVGSTSNLTDVDSANFDGGTLTVSFTGGTDATEDVLAIRNQGTGAGQIGVSGANVTYGGVIIGTWAGGTGSSNLVVTLDADATTTGTAALINNITYVNTDADNPTTTTRNIRFVLTDGDGGTSAASNTFMSVTAVNDAPTVIILDVGDTAAVRLNATTSGDQSQPAIAALPGGGWVAVWTSAGQDGDGTGIYAQRFDASGVAAGSEIRVNANATYHQYSPSVSTFSDGGFVVGWTEMQPGVAAWAEARVFAADGTPLTGDLTISVPLSNSNEGYAAQVQVLAPDRWAIVWSNEVNGAARAVAGRIFDRAGAAQTAQFTVGTSGAAPDSWAVVPRATGLADGGMAVTWNHYDTSSQTTIRVQFVNADGTLRGAFSGLSGTGIGDITQLPDGRVVVLSTGGATVYAAVFSSAGAITVADFVVTTSHTGASAPQVTASGDGFVAAWPALANDGVTQEIVIQRYDATGAPLGVATRARPSAEGAVGDIALTTLADGSALLGWRADGLDGSGGGAYAGVLQAAVREGAANGTVVASAIDALDPDSGDTHSYSLFDNAGGRFTIDGVTGRITVANSGLLDYETGTTHTIIVRATDGGGLSVDRSLTIAVLPVNEAPAFSNLDGTPAFTENGPAVVLDADVTVGDPELTAANSFNGATLTLVRNGGASAQDQFSATGTLSALTQGGTLVVGGTTIGAVTANSAGSLVLTFNGSATSARVNSALQQIAYANSGDTPPAGVQISWTFSDGNAGGQGSGGVLTATGSTTVSITGVNDPPALAFGEGDRSFTEGGAAVMIDALATVSDPDSTDFSGGTLTITTTANSTSDDRTELLNTGMGAGQVGVSGFNVHYSGTQVGTIAGGVGTSPFVVTFNASADATAVREVMRNIRFWVAGDTPSTATRTISAVLTDGDGGTSGTQTKQITVVAANDAPAIADAGVPGPVSFTEQSPVAISSLFAVTDPDSASLNGATITISGNYAPGIDTLNYTDMLGISGSWNAGSGTLTLSGTASVANYVTAIRSIAFYNSADDPGTLQRTVALTVTDGADTSNTLTRLVDVTAVNDAPVLNSLGSPALASVTEDSGAPTGAVGTLVATLVDFASPAGQVDNVTDADGAAGLGIAVTDADATNGTWFYSIDNGATWSALGAVSAGNARLLAADAGTRLYFQGNANFTGTITHAITFHAWDRTSGVNGSVADISDDTVLDRFSSVSYANNDGTTNWTSHWIETDVDGGGAGSGRLLVRPTGDLEVRARATNNNLYREVDLSGATTATLSFDFVNTLSAGDTIVVQASGNGGASYTTLTGGTFSSSSNTGSGAFSLDISSFAAANTRIRFLVSSVGGEDRLYVDNVQVAAPGGRTGGSSAFSLASDTASLTVSAANDPPSANAGGPYTLAEGATLVLNASASSDPDGDTLTYAWDLDNDGNFGEAGEPLTAGPSVSWATLQSFGIDDDGSYTIGLRVSDGTVNVATTATLTVTNVAPTISVSGAATIAAGQTYTLTVGVTDAGADTVTGWTVNWGDGTVSTYAGSPTSATHTFVQGGFSRGITVSVTDEDGSYTPSDLLLSSYLGDRVLRLDGTSGSLEATLPATFTVDGPTGLAIGPDGYLYVASLQTDQVVRYDLATNTLVGTFVTAASGGLDTPAALAFGPDGHLYVASYGTNQILKYDGSTGGFLGAFSSLNSANALAWGPDGHLYAGSWFTGEVRRFDISGAAVDAGAFLTLAGGFGVSSLLFGTDGYLYVGDAGGTDLLKYDATTGALAATIDGNNAPYGLAIGPDGRLLVADFNAQAVERFRFDTGASLGNFDDGATGVDRPWGLLVSPSVLVAVTPPAPGVTVSPISGNTTELGGTATFTVVLDLAPTADVTITVTSGDATEGTVSTSLLTFTSANWSIAQTVTVTGVNDSLDDGDIAFTILTGTSASADPSYQGLAVADVAVTNIDDDATPVLVIPSPVTTAEDTSVSLAGLSVSDASGDLSTLQLGVSSGSLTVSLAGGSSISTGMNGGGSLTLTGSQSSLVAALATLRYRPSLGYAGGDSLSITATDTTGLSASGTLAISVNAVNDAPIARDDSAAAVGATGVSGNVLTNDADAEGDPLQVTQFSIAGDPAVHAAGATVAIPLTGSFSLAASGSFTFTPQVGFSGAAPLVTYTVADGNGGIATGGLTLRAGSSMTGWGVSGSSSVTEGQSASYVISLTDAVAFRQSASIALGLTDTTTSGSDHASFAAAVTAAIASRPDLSFDGTRLSYSPVAFGSYARTYDATGALGTASIAGTGTSLGLRDDEFVRVDLDFAFDYFGVAHSSVIIDANGYVTFGASPGSIFTNGTLATGTALGGLPAIAAFWDDLDPNAGGAVYVETQGSPGTRQFVIEWSNTPFFGSGSADGATIQLVLHEGSGLIEMRYLDVDFAGVDASRDSGAGATIGLQGGSGTVDEFSFDTASVVAGSSLAYRPQGVAMSPLTITLSTTDDSIVEGTEDFAISLSAAIGSGITSADTVTTLLTDNDVVAPVNVTPTAVTTIEDTVFAFSGGSAISVTDGDVNVTSVSIAVTSGTVTLTVAGGASVSAGSLGSSAFTLSGALTQINASLATLTYTPDADFAGTDTLVISSMDASSLSDTDAVTLTVSPLDDAPVLTGVTLSVSQGGTVTLAPTNFTIVDPDGPAGTRLVDVRNLAGGLFELVSAPGVPLSTFAYADVVAGLVRFVHSGTSAAPAFEASVRDSLAPGTFVPAAIGFTPTPVITTPGPSPEQAYSIVLTPTAPSPETRQETSGPTRPADPVTTGTASQSGESPQGAGGRGERSPGSVDPRVLLQMAVPRTPAPAPGDPSGTGDPGRDAATTGPIGGGGAVGVSAPTAAPTGSSGVAAVPQVPTAGAVTADGVQSAWNAPAPLSVGLPGDSPASGPENRSADEQQFEIMVNGVRLTGVSLSVGVVTWALRAGGIVSSLLASLPAWRFVDPLPVLERAGRTRVVWRDDEEHDGGDDTAKRERAVEDLFGGPS